jgi:hypothetical protein
LRLVDLYFRLGRDADSERELGHLMELYGQTGDLAQLIPIVADMAAQRSGSVVLQKALADLYIESHQLVQAVAALDALGDLQIGAGHVAEAANTIERIVSLAPDNVADYRSRLARIQKGQ